MKIEIDFSRPDELRKTKRELEMALATIESALAQIGTNGHDAAQPSLPNLGSHQPTKAAISNYLDGIIASMLPEFTMREVMSYADAVGIPHSRVRREIASMTEMGALVLIQKGQGRRPTTFRKA